jgi:hypothetical protein
MSIIFYYLHLDDAQLAAVREEPALVWSLDSDPRFRTAKLTDIDKDYDIIAWLLSPKKRNEQTRQVASYKVFDIERQSNVTYTKAEFLRLVDEELMKLGASLEDPAELAADHVLEALEGRGTEDQREPKVNFGLGDARLFRPAEVARAAAALSSIDATDLRKSFDRTVMAKFDVGGVGWLDENDSVLDEFLVPQFNKIQRFYIEAEKLGHNVLVIYQ